MTKVSRRKKTRSGFVIPSKAARIKALGKPKTLAMSKVIADAGTAYIPMKPPKKDDWLDMFTEEGEGADDFEGVSIYDKRGNLRTNNILYILPIIKEKN